MEHKEIKRTIEHATDTPIKEWWVLSIANDLLKEMNVKARFETGQQNIYFGDKEGETIKLIVGEDEK